MTFKWLKHIWNINECYAEDSHPPSMYTQIFHPPKENTKSKTLTFQIKDTQFAFIKPQL